MLIHEITEIESLLPHLRAEVKRFLTQILRQKHQNLRF